MISIIIPIYNHAAKIAKCLDSILKQTYKDIEVIAVNDGSTDDIDAVIGKYKNIYKSEAYNLFYISQKNQGAPAARNVGYKIAKGDYLFFCDADSIIRPDALEKMLKTLTANPSASFAYSSFLWGNKFFKAGPYDGKKLKQMPYIHTMALIRRNDFPGWDENIKKFQDWDLWLTMLANGKRGIWIQETLFTVSPGGTISSWLPAFAYKLFPFLKQVKKYNEAMKTIKEKHKIAPFQKEE